MSCITLLDTSVYLNILNVPGRNQARSAVLKSFEDRVDRGDTFLLPMAAVWETGNHIARLNNGDHRRKHAKTFVDDVSKALNGEAPYRATYIPDESIFLKWIGDFPKHAGQGLSLADMSIIKEQERIAGLSGDWHVKIWSLDQALMAYSDTP